MTLFSNVAAVAHICSARAQLWQTVLAAQHRHRLGCKQAAAGVLCCQGGAMHQGLASCAVGLSCSSSSNSNSGHDGHGWLLRVYGTAIGVRPLWQGCIASEPCSWCFTPLGVCLQKQQ